MKAKEKKERLELLWQALLKNNPTIKDLIYVACYIKPLKEEAWQELLNKGIKGNDLSSIIMREPLLKEDAWQRLKKDITNDYLCHIIHHFNSFGSLKEEVWQELLKRGDINESLCYIIKEVESLREKAWQELLKRSPTDEDLIFVANWGESLKEEAWQNLLERGLTNNALCNIIRSGKRNFLRDEAARQLLKQSPNDCDLKCIFDSVEPLRREVLEIISSLKDSRAKIIEEMQLII